MPETPFDSVESAQHFIGLLREAVDEAEKGIHGDIAECPPSETRRLEALRLVDHKLKALATHVHATSRILNDLRMLRRLLVGEE